MGKFAITAAKTCHQAVLWGAVGLLLVACGRSESSSPSSESSRYYIPRLTQERCFSHQSNYTFQSTLGQGSLDVWRSLGPWTLCVQSSNRSFSSRWRFSPSDKVQAYPHLTLFAGKLPIDWQTQSLPQETWTLRDDCQSACRDDMGWDLWVSDHRHATPFVAGNGEEVMVLPVYRLSPPPGKSQGIDLSGAGWSVYRFHVNGWSIVQVLFPGNVHRISLSITNILRKLADNGEISSRYQFLIAANIGTEIVQGKGSSTLVSGE